jgi:hypothetical protein
MNNNITSNSFFLLNFIDKNIDIEYKYTNNKINIFLIKILNYLEEASYYLLNNKKIKNNIQEIKYENNIIFGDKFLMYIPSNIKKHIYDKSKSIINYKDKNFLDMDININFILEEEDILNFDFFNIYKILYWLYIIVKYIKPEKCKTLTIYIFMTSLKKTLPSFKNVILDREHINTAYTYPCNNKNGKIVIFRKEEWFKCFIHETIHIFNMDLLSNKYDLNEKIKLLVKVTTEEEFYESYTEFWAEIMNIIFLSYKVITSYKILNKDEYFINIFNYLINNERKFNIIQVVKILRFMGLKFEDLYLEENKIKYNEKTNIFSYFILKLILLYNYNDFLMLCIKNNKDILVFDNTIKNINNFFDFIKKNYKKKQMLLEIKKIEKIVNNDNLLNKNIKNKLNNNYLKNNLRMTLFD